jgi:hypothetical protein
MVDAPVRWQQSIRREIVPYNGSLYLLARRDRTTLLRSITAPSIGPQIPNIQTAMIVAIVARPLMVHAVA